MLSSVVRAAQKSYYESIIQKSTNKVKTTWDIVKSHTNNKMIINKPNIKILKIIIKQLMHSTSIFLQWQIS